tara:strand:- start:174 stop:449 length:276 start_codon:yes stop_codon:yes gene_type:complete
VALEVLQRKHPLLAQLVTGMMGEILRLTLEALGVVALVLLALIIMHHAVARVVLVNYFPLSLLMELTHLMRHLLEAMEATLAAVVGAVDLI